MLPAAGELEGLCLGAEYVLFAAPLLPAPYGGTPDGFAPYGGAPDGFAPYCGAPYTSESPNGTAGPVCLCAGLAAAGFLCFMNNIVPTAATPMPARIPITTGSIEPPVVG